MQQLGRTFINKKAQSVSAHPSLGRAGPVGAKLLNKGSARRIVRPSAFPYDFSEDPANVLEILREENQLLKETIAEAKVSIAALETQLRTAGVPIPPPEDAPGIMPPAPEDYWSPVLEMPANHEYRDRYGSISAVPGHDGTECFRWDPSLWNFAEHFRYRWRRLRELRAAIQDSEGGLDAFTRAYTRFGLNRGEHQGRRGIWYREWAPGAKALALIGDFNNWTPGDQHWAFKNEWGVWELFLPDAPDGSPALRHRCRVKCRLESAEGRWLERIPAWIKWATQEWNEILFNGVYWDPPESGAPGEIAPDKKYVFKYPRPPRPRALRIYECHVGMSSQQPKINSYLEFRRDVLPRVRALGYNAIQIMAIQEHAYYGSFGYHVTSFFAPSSRCGTPEELRALIDEAHRLGLVVLMDIVHSHASKNTNDGINMFDGTDGMYFHGGARGQHWMWDSRCFNYGNWETLRFLLSNARYWADEFKFDGFRFDGVTSMMYHHHGLSYTFTGAYEEYFGLNTDVDALVYLMLANNMLHDLFPNCVTIAEDVSGMPALCRPWHEGGLGFDYRLHMAAADKWVELLRGRPDGGWDPGEIAHTLTNRRYAEACVGYAESHDQALVGDKTLAFWLMDKEMYDHMSLPGLGPPSPIIDRGIALHKMIRLATFALGGEGYLNFMGNEFGHPEWIDFPRDDSYDPSTGRLVPGNGGSLDKCRRRWDLADSPHLRYRWLGAFDRALMHLDKAFGLLSSPHCATSRADPASKLLVIERGELLAVLNWHPTDSYTDLRVGCNAGGAYKVVLSSDEEVFGGFRNVSKEAGVTFTASPTPHDGRPFSLQLYAPSRTAVVYAPAEWVDPGADLKPHGIAGLGVRDMGPYFAR
ncbi:hypothetical protein Agub_g4269 [Astrephomene gubernaculifera]|uniref:1,4-alpha-glucan branching enzyme n=1 Tax=Astrephomene gubernaculifera TaxID=47775 RepID=A0AAD3DMT2_9CHLO|nr:hypothetical protein Agub_g4269 [Astrephomene gubernaculifera]